MNLFKSFYKYIDERLDIEPLIDFAKHKEVPRHKFDWAYYFGGLTLFFFIVQVITGILLLLYYRPTAKAAFESVQFIMTNVSFGWLVRSIHSWSANLMILSAFIHMFSVYFMKSYTKPREMTWWTGCVLLVIAMGFGFSGYLLPWNQLAFFATRVGTDMVSKIPFIGNWLLEVLRGGDDVTGATLTRFFGIHVAVLPMIFTIFLTIHLLLIQRQGIHLPKNLDDNSDSKAPIPFFPNFVYRELIVWLIGLALLAILAALFPWDLGIKADPFASAPAGIKPEWYFLFMFETLKKIPATVLGMEGELFGLGFFSIAGLLWFLVPIFDRKALKGESSRLVTIIGLIVLFYITMVTLFSLSGVI